MVAAEPSLELQHALTLLLWPLDLPLETLKLPTPLTMPLAPLQPLFLRLATLLPLMNSAPLLCLTKKPALEAALEATEVSWGPGDPPALGPTEPLQVWWAPR